MNTDPYWDINTDPCGDSDTNKGAGYFPPTLETACRSFALREVMKQREDLQNEINKEVKNETINSWKR